MGEPTNRGECEDDNEELVISTREELIAHLEQNPDVVVGIVRHLAANFSDSYPIELVLEQGYEDAHDILDLFAEDMAIETLTATPYIDSSTDWGGHLKSTLRLSGQMYVQVTLYWTKNLESNFGSSLLSACLNLIEEKSKAREDSTFIDIFGLKVAQVYKALLANKLQERQKDRELEDKRRQEDRIQEDHVLEWVFRTKQLTLYPVPEPVPYFEVLCRVSRRICVAASTQYQQEWLARELEAEFLQAVVEGFSFLMQEFVDTISYGHQQGEISVVLDKMKSAQDALYQVTPQGSCSEPGNSDGARLRELGISLLQQTSTTVADKLG